MKIVLSQYRLTLAALVAGAVLALSGPGYAQQPSAAAMTSAREIVDIKGAAALFNPVIPGVIEKAKLTFLQTNPNLQNDLDAVANAMRAEYAPRQAEIRDRLAALYAKHFSEAELKEVIAFYKSPIGKKMNQEEPKFVDQSMSSIQDWADKMFEEVVAKFRVEMKKKGHDI